MKTVSAATARLPSLLNLPQEVAWPHTPIRAVPPAPGLDVAAERLADHRPHYLDYEGPLSGDRGAVTRWDAGHYELESQSPARWVVTLHGHQLTGQLVLQAVAESPSQWTARFSSPST